MKNKEATPTFGKEDISLSEKFGKVDSVFESVANRYDLMNDLMSFGFHRLWKKYAVELLDVGSGQVILDLAAGTGDITKLIGENLPESSELLSCDPNFRMLSIGRDKAIDKGLIERINFVGASAEFLPLADSSVNRVIVGFGLRNFSDKRKSLEEIYRILEVGSKLVILEFSKVNDKVLSKLYDLYSFNVIPVIGDIVAKDKASYQYLVDSIRSHPDQDSIKKLMEDIGFENTNYFNVLSGIVTVHVSHKT